MHYSRNLTAISRPFRLLTAVVLVGLSCGMPVDQLVAADENGKNRWEASIQKFEVADRRAFPPKHGVLFVGSSSIVGWDLGKHFPELPVINRGFGGSQIADSIYFAERIVLPYEPKTIVLYAGDNDIASGKNAEQAHRDYQKFVAKIHRALPKTRIVFVAIKPSISRWNLIGEMRKANALIRATAKKDDRLIFVDIDTPMIDSDGKPRKGLFKSDGLHLNERGYKLWSRLVRPHLSS